MQRWKRRAKCALALVVAAALAGSNADGLLLSAFAEENVQSAGGQSGGAAEEAENPSDIPVADPTGEAGQDEDGVVTGGAGENPVKPSGGEDQEGLPEDVKPSDGEGQEGFPEDVEPSDGGVQEGLPEDVKPSDGGVQEGFPEDVKPSGGEGQEKLPVEPSDEGNQEGFPEDVKPSGGENQENSAVPSEGDEIGAGKAEVVTFEETFVPEVELPDNDELFEGYVYQLFYGDSDVSFYGNLGGEKLTGNEAVIYEGLKAYVKEVAAGTKTSTKEIEISGVSFSGSLEEISAAVGSAVGKAYSYLLMDCPYELYWHDKSKEGGIGSASYINNDVASTIAISMTVAKEYRDGNEYTINRTEVSQATAAAAKAKEIVAKYSGKSDYEKLKGYLDEICSLVSYNDEAAEDSTTPYGNPWQLIWVFDGNPETEVVCEGYSKAFQYLCDESGFTGCYTVTGTMGGGTGAGPHMWNIVTLEGKNYLVDVTNCDGDGVGRPDQLFLAGTAGSVQNGYTFTLNNGLSKITYVYDSDQYGLLGEVLNLADAPYENDKRLPVSVTVPEVKVVYGDSVDNSVLSSYTAQASDGAAVQGTISWSSEVTTYGNAGTKTLKAVFTPNDTDKYQPVNDIEVSVTVQPKTISPTVNVEGTYRYTGQAVIPVLVVGAGSIVLGVNDYEVALSDNINAGTAKVSVTPKSGGNYTWTDAAECTFTIGKADCVQSVKDVQNVLEGIGEFVEPKFTGVNNEKLEGSLKYSYGSVTDGAYADVAAALKNLSLGDTGDITYTFTPASLNYNSCTGKIHFTVKDIEFKVGDDIASETNAVILKESPVYGDIWEEIIKIGGITAYAGTKSDSDPAHFSLDVSGVAGVGDGQVFHVLYTGSLGGKDYDKEEVCSGTVNVAKRTITVTAGTYQVTKVYDKTVNPGTAAGELALGNILSQDAGKVTVTTAPVAYSSPNVGGQARMTLPLTLSGDAAGNYTLGSATVEVPCAITPKTIVPVLEIIGTYSYTGQLIIPEVAVSYTEGGKTEVLSVSDYGIMLSDSINAGTAKVSVSPREGGNYTWEGSVEGTFLISKVDYPYTRTAELSARYGNDASFDLASLLPEGYVLGSVSVADSDTVLKGIPTVKGSVLSYTLSADRAKVGRSALVTVPVAESTNYNPFELVLTITMSDKLEQADFHFSQSVVDKVYGDSDFVAETVNAAEGSSLSFTSSNPNVAVVDNTGTVRIISAGSTVITAWASETDEYLRGTAVCTLQVARKALGWDASGLYAVDREGTVSEQRKASLYGELKVNGILDADREAVTFNCPAGRLAGTYGAVTPGVQRVFLAWADPANPAVLQGAKASNYVLPSVLPECTGRINAVNGSLQPPAESTEKVQYNLSMETGISQVPPAFAGIESLNTPAKIESQMKLNIQRQAASVPEGNTVVYDVTLMVNINGAGWQAAGKDNFPADGLTITLPYPEGTSKDANDFIVCHLFTQDGNGHKAGEAEYPFVTKTDAGIRFKVTGLSPISVGWTKAGELNNAVEVGRNDSSASDDRQNAAVQSPKTSDENTILWYLVSMIVSGGLLAGMAFRRNRKNCR